MKKKILKAIWLHGSIGAILLVGSQNLLAYSKKLFGTPAEQESELKLEWTYWTAFKNFRESINLMKKGLRS